MTSVVTQAVPTQRPATVPFSTGQPATVALVVLVGTTSGDEHTIEVDLRREGFQVHAGKLAERVPQESSQLVQRLTQVLQRRLNRSLHITTLAVGQQVAANSARAVEEAPLVFGDLSIDWVRREIWVSGQQVQLSKSEFGLLYLMASREGRVFTRDELVSSGNQSHCPVTERSIDVHVAALRRKLGQAARHVQTVRGVGYRFVAECRALAR